jgi:predicted dehydrogenase
MAEARKVRFGVIGCGGAALPVAQALATSAVAELGAAQDLNPALARDLAGRYEATVYETLPALLGDSTIEAVYIAVPHHLLAPLAMQALRAGKHALVEKPMALSLAAADDLIALADGQRLALGVFYDLRQAAQAVQARTLVRAGAIGAIIAVHIQTLIDKASSYWQTGLSGRWASPWRARKAEAGGGVVLMNSSHQLDVVRFVTGLEVTSISGQVAALVAPVEVEDTAATSLRYDNGAIGSLFAGAHLAGARPGGECIELYGREGQLRLPSLYGDDPVQLYLRREWGEPALAAGQWHSLPHEPAPIFQRTVDAFAQAVRCGEPPSPSGRDARQVLAIVLSLYQSAEAQSVQRIEHQEATHASS